MAVIRFCVATLLLCAIVACGPESPSSFIDQSAEAAIISNLENEWSAMYGAQNLEGITALLANESVLIMPGSTPIVGVDDIREATRVMLDSGDSVSWVSDFAFVAPSGDMAYDYGTAVTTLADGTSIEGSYLVVWVKEDGEWKVAADMFN